MRLLRFLSFIGAAMLVVGDPYRALGTGRPVALWLDDILAAAMLAAAAVAVRRPTRRARGLLSASWGVAAALLYGSFAGKLMESADGTFSLAAVLIGAAFVGAVACLIASLVLPDKTTT